MPQACGGRCVEVEGERTLRASTSWAASRRVRVAIWSTIWEILGERAEGGGGGVAEAVWGVGSARAAEVEAKEREREGTMDAL